MRGKQQKCHVSCIIRPLNTKEPHPHTMRFEAGGNFAKNAGETRWGTGIPNDARERAKYQLAYNALQISRI